MGLPPRRMCLSKQQQPAALAASATASLLGDEFSLAPDLLVSSAKNHSSSTPIISSTHLIDYSKGKVVLL
jgi:hypothetical protein